MTVSPLILSEKQLNPKYSKCEIMKLKYLIEASASIANEGGDNSGIEAIINAELNEAFSATSVATDQPKNQNYEVKNGE